MVNLLRRCHKSNNRSLPTSQLENKNVFDFQSENIVFKTCLPFYLRAMAIFSGMMRLSRPQNKKKNPIHILSRPIVIPPDNKSQQKHDVTIKILIFDEFFETDAD